MLLTVHVRSSLFQVVMQPRLAVNYRRFETACHSTLQGSCSMSTQLPNKAV